VLVVGVLSLFPGVAPEEHHPPGLINSRNTGHVPGAFSELCLNGSVGAVPIKVGPTVTLRPPDEVAILQATWGLALNVGVEPLFDDRTQDALRRTEVIEHSHMGYTGSFANCREACAPEAACRVECHGRFQYGIAFTGAAGAVGLGRVFHRHIVSG